jgi:hypothetical protein
MKIRFSNLIKGLRQLGDDVMVITPCINPPKTFHGAKAQPFLCLAHACLTAAPQPGLKGPMVCRLTLHEQV